MVPEAVRRHSACRAARWPVPKASAPVAATPALAGSARTFQRDLYLYWSYVRDNGVRLTQKDEVQKTDLKKLNATLLVRETLGKGEGELDHLRLRFLRQTAHGAEPAGLRRERLGWCRRRARPISLPWRRRPACSAPLKSGGRPTCSTSCCCCPARRGRRGSSQGLLTAHPLVIEARQTVLRAMAARVRSLRRRRLAAAGRAVRLAARRRL